MLDKQEEEVMEWKDKRSVKKWQERTYFKGQKK